MFGFIKKIIIGLRSVCAIESFSRSLISNFESLQNAYL